jgi:hypothetical protein
MTEEFRFDQVRRDARTVQRYHRGQTPLAAGMKCSGDQFLAGAGFSGNQHSRIGRGNFANVLEQRPHWRAVAAEGEIPRGGRRGFGECGSQRFKQSAGRFRIGQVIAGACFYRGDCIRHICGFGENQHRRLDTFCQQRPGFVFIGNDGVSFGQRAEFARISRSRLGADGCVAVRPQPAFDLHSAVGFRH